MKILIVGSDKVFAIENHYLKYFREVDTEVLNFPAQSIFYDYYQKSVLHKIFFRMGLSNILARINKQFKKQIEEFRPEIVFVFKGMEIFPGTLKWVKKKKIKLVNYNPDNPFVFSGKGSGNSNLKNSIGLYDLHLTYNSEVKNLMEATYGIPTCILPFGFDINKELFEKCLRQNEIIKTCFLGNPDKFRAQFILQLAESGIELDVYGNGWNKFLRHPNIQIFNPVLGDAFWMTLRKYRIQLNLDRPHTSGTHNMRSFEIPAIGGIQLAPYTFDHQFYFEDGKEIFLFSDVKDCEMKIRKILCFTKDESDKIRAAARGRSLNSGYSYKERAAEALNAFRSING